MRIVTDHKLNGLNDQLHIEAMDEPVQGRACHKYEIRLAATDGTNKVWPIDFQNGPVKESGFNGLSQESLLAIVIDHLRSFQAGQYSCRENAIALTKVEEAMLWLKKRTQDRLSRGVEGTNIK